MRRPVPVNGGPARGLSCADMGTPGTNNAAEVRPAAVHPRTRWTGSGGRVSTARRPTQADPTARHPRACGSLRPSPPHGRVSTACHPRAGEGQAVARKPERVARKRLPVARKRQLVAREPFPVARESFAVARKPFPVAREPFPVARKPFPVTRKPFPVARKPFPVAREPFPVARKPLRVAREAFPFIRGSLTVARRPAAIAGKRLQLARNISRHDRRQRGCPGRRPAPCGLRASQLAVDGRHYFSNRCLPPANPTPRFRSSRPPQRTTACRPRSASPAARSGCAGPLPAPPVRQHTP